MSAGARPHAETLARCDALMEALGRWALRREKRLEEGDTREARRIHAMLDELATARHGAVTGVTPVAPLLALMLRGATLLERQHAEILRMRAPRAPSIPVPEDSGPVHLKAFMARAQRSEAATEPPPPPPPRQLVPRSTPPDGRRRSVPAGAPERRRSRG